jgi:hypothetical protein
MCFCSLLKYPKLSFDCTPFKNGLKLCTKLFAQKQQLAQEADNLTTTSFETVLKHVSIRALNRNNSQENRFECLFEQAKLSYSAWPAADTK